MNIFPDGLMSVVIYYDGHRDYGIMVGPQVPVAPGAVQALAHAVLARYAEDFQADVLEDWSAALVWRSADGATRRTTFDLPVWDRLSQGADILVHRMEWAACSPHEMVSETIVCRQPRCIVGCFDEGETHILTQPLP